MRIVLATALILVSIGAARAIDDSAKANLAEAIRAEASQSPAASYRNRVDKMFLEAGINIQTFVATPKEKTGLASEQYPALVLFGAMNRPMVYQIGKALDAFADARTAGLRTVQFVSNNGQGEWHFDLRKPSPTCSRDLCF